MKYKIYLVTNLITNKQYVGQTRRDLNKRFIQHISKGNYSYNDSFLSASIKKHGRHNFKIEVLMSFDFINQYELNKLEELFIKEINTIAPNGYNKSPGCSVTQLTEEGRLKKQKYYENRWKDDLDYRNKMIEHNLIKARKAAHTQESEKKKSLSLSKRYHVVSPNNIEFCIIGLTDFCNTYNLDPSAVSKVSNGKLKHYKQWRITKLSEDRILTYDYRKKPKYLLTDPNNIQMCCYGLDNFKSEGFNINIMVRCSRSNSRNKTYCGWKVSKIE
jgi:group I intron endonuclease